VVTKMTVRNPRSDSNSRSVSSSEGFTLIELMIVVAIIGILAAIAVPAYQVYAVRGQYSRVVAESGTVRSAVESCVADGRVDGVGPGVNECDMQTVVSGSTLLTGVNAGVIIPPATGAPVLAFAPGGAATITASFGNSAAPVLGGGSVVWSRDTAGSWTCRSAGGIAARYTLSSCP
jgi:type IV pilus assembly protein PilA